MTHDETHEQSLMESTGLGLLPGLALGMSLIVVAMAALLTGSMWAVWGVLILIGLVLAAVLFVVVAVTSEGERGRRLRGLVPGLAEAPAEQADPHA